MSARTYESHASAVRYCCGYHNIPCPCGSEAQLHLEHTTAVVSCDDCGRFKTHRRRHGYGPNRQPTGGVSQRTLDDIDKIWCRTVPIKGTIGEHIFNLTHRTWLGADADVNYTVDELEGIFRFHPGHKSVCALMADSKSDYLCGLLEMYISHRGWVFSESVTGTNGKIWPSVESISREFLTTEAVEG